LSEGRSLRYENTFLLTTLLGSHIFDDMKNFLNFFFWIQSFYSATSKLVLRRGGPKHGPTLGGVYLQKHVAIGGGCGRSSLMDIWVAAWPEDDPL